MRSRVWATCIPVAHRHLQRLRYCRLVVIEDTLTAILYPDDASIDGVILFRGQCTHTPFGLLTWKGRARPRTVAGSEALDRYSTNLDVYERLPNAKLPAYDRSRDPWHELRFHPAQLWNDRADESGYGAEARAKLMRSEGPEYGENFLDSWLDDSGTEWS